LKFFYLNKKILLKDIMIKQIFFPLNGNQDVSNLQIGDRILISGSIFTGRDAALPRLVDSIKKGEKLIKLEGSAFMHTAVSDAGISPTTSNKVEIEGSIPFLSKCGVKMHIGKGSLSPTTIQALSRFKSVFLVTPPAAALLKSKIVKKKLVAFPEEGIEAIYQLDVNRIPGIVASARGEIL